jgi:DNA-directed RNA polymerase specialized sigma24 family protein
MLFFTMDYRSSPETLLINKSKKGDTKAFEELMLRSKDYLASWIHNKTGSENDTEDIYKMLEEY